MSLFFRLFDLNVAGPLSGIRRCARNARFEPILVVRASLNVIRSRIFAHARMKHVSHQHARGGLTIAMYHSRNLTHISRSLFFRIRGQFRGVFHIRFCLRIVSLVMMVARRSNILLFPYGFQLCRTYTRVQGVLRVMDKYRTAPSHGIVCIGQTQLVRRRIYPHAMRVPLFFLKCSGPRNGARQVVRFCVFVSALRERVYRRFANLSDDHVKGCTMVLTFGNVAAIYRRFRNGHPIMVNAPHYCRLRVRRVIHLHRQGQMGDIERRRVAQPIMCDFLLLASNRYGRNRDACRRCSSCVFRRLRAFCQLLSFNYAYRPNTSGSYYKVNRAGDKSSTSAFELLPMTDSSIYNLHSGPLYRHLESYEQGPSVWDSFAHSPSVAFVTLSTFGTMRPWRRWHTTHGIIVSLPTLT